ncbi:MAG: glycosyltransferase [Candidatus Tantalella remota]|nr:glycosyltransferase [Candidatus Tantalella remota]
MTNSGRHIRGMTDWCMVEEYIHGFDYAGKNVLSLTPEASYCLKREGVKYSILEDHYDEEDLWLEEKKYFDQQLEWFARFDALLKEKIPYCGENEIDLAKSHYYRIKCLVDSVILNSVIFSKVVKATRPGRVFYLCVAENDGYSASIYEPFESQKRVIKQVAEKVFGKYDVICERVYADKDADGVIPQRPSLSVLGKEVLKKLRLKSVYSFFKYRKFSRTPGAAKNKAGNILVLHSGCLAIDSLMRDVICSGGNVYLKSGRHIERISSIFQQRCMDLNEAVGVELDAGTKKSLVDAFVSFGAEKGLLEWINERCGIDVSDILMPYFKDLFEMIFLENLAELPLLDRFIKEKEIDLVVARSSSEKEVISALLMASKESKRACFQHSCGAFDGEREHVSELMLFDHYFAIHREAEQHMREVLRKNRKVGNCKVYQDPCQMKVVRERWKNDHRDGNLIMYVPTKLFFGFRTYNGYLYPLTWYFELQKAIIDLFCERKDLKFIFKFAPGQNWSARSILKYIEDKAAPNIFIETRPVADCLGRVGRVLLDFPSTSLYEAAAAGIPVMSLSHSLLGVRKLAEDLFGTSIREFDGVEDAVDAVKTYLNEEPGKYRVDLPMDDVKGIDILCDIKNAVPGEERVYGKNR